MFRNFIAGIQFLTIIPCGATQRLDPGKTLPLFPVCGLVIGALLVLTDTIAMRLWTPAAAAVVDVVSLVVITGALHLDGLGDTADGLYSKRPPEKALAIMKDSRIGAIGMVAIACVLALKWAGLSNLETYRKYWLFVVPAFSRTTVLFGVQWLPYGRPEGGTGRSFFDSPPRLSDYWALVLLLLLTFLFTNWGVLWITSGFLMLMMATLLYYRYKINCITGDMLGAMIEIVETGLFLILSTFH